MIHEKALLDLLQARNVANTGTAVRRRMTEPIPRVQAVQDWNEADRLPAHRWMKWLRPVAWLPPVVLLIQWWLLVQGRNVLGLRSASLLACWLPLVFFGAYLAFPDIFVWGGLSAPAPARGTAAGPGHPGLAADACEAVAHPFAGQRRSDVGSAGSPGVPCGRPVPLAVLCLALGVALAVLCERRRPPERRRERGMILMLAAMLAFPLGYSLNLALNRPRPSPIPARWWRCGCPKSKRTTAAWCSGGRDGRSAPRWAATPPPGPRRGRPSTSVCGKAC